MQVASFLVRPPPGFSVPPSVTPALATGKTREYFIAVEEEDWDYAPSGKSTATAADGVMMKPPDVDYLARTRYRKARYVEYTDAAFTTRKPVPPEWAHKGILGPVIRAEVGDEIRVMLLNRGSRPCSFRPYGLAVPAGEGISFRGDTGGSGGTADVVLPGGEHEYVFDVPERAGPGPGDGSSLAWIYYSDVDHVADAYTGLVGAIIVARRGAADPSGRPLDVDKEFVALFSVRLQLRTRDLANPGLKRPKSGYLVSCFPPSIFRPKP
jgi:manganese oxidase